MTTTAPPRDDTGGSDRPVRRGRFRFAVVIAVIVGAVGFLLFQGLDSATVYFRNADEAVADKHDLGTRRFRLQGTVVDGTVHRAESSSTTDFDVAFKGVTVAVVHTGNPPELFKPGIPVVLEGRWDGNHFASDRIMVKHSEEYKADNPDRVDPGSP